MSTNSINPNICHRPAELMDPAHNEVLVRALWPHWSPKQEAKMLAALADTRIGREEILVLAVLIEAAGPSMSKEVAMTDRNLLRQVNRMSAKIAKRASILMAEVLQ